VPPVSAATACIKTIGFHSWPIDLLAILMQLPACFNMAYLPVFVYITRFWDGSCAFPCYWTRGIISRIQAGSFSRCKKIWEKQVGVNAVERTQPSSHLSSIPDACLGGIGAMRQHCGLPRACWHQECEVSASATAINFHSIYHCPFKMHRKPVLSADACNCMTYIYQDT
jgi:hypothetical protein